MCVMAAGTSLLVFKLNDIKATTIPCTVQPYMGPKLTKSTIELIYCSRPAEQWIETQRCEELCICKTCSGQVGDIKTTLRVRDVTMIDRK